MVDKLKIMTFKKILCVIIAIGLMLPIIVANVYAADEVEKTEIGTVEIDSIGVMARETMAKSKIPAASIAAIKKGSVNFSAYNNSSSTTLDKTSLFQIGSLTKGFTGLAILLLESEGKLALTDPVTKHIPWLTFSYQGSAVKAEEMTIANLLYQTSGLTNNESKYPNAAAGMTLEKNIRQLVGAELSSKPNEKFAYSNANYNILGLVIETISKMPYEDFMVEKVLHPLGLNNTFTNPEEAHRLRKITIGNRLSFLKTTPYDVPVPQGAVPAGYFYSNAEDLARWAQLQMGYITVPAFTKIIEKSHVPNAKSVVDSNTQYAAGWFVDKTNGLIYHSGGTVSYSSDITMNPKTMTAGCVLTSLNASANANDIARNIVNILNGKSIQKWTPDIWLTIDTIFTFATYISIALFVIAGSSYISQGVQIKNRERIKGKRGKSNITLLIVSILMVLASAAEIVFLPIAFGSTWIDLVAWAPSSLYFGTISFAVLALLLITCSIFIGRFQKRRKT